jgi:cytochrome c-type biogenesis protein CcmH
VLEACARALSAELRCMVCQNQSIDDSNADLAKNRRLLVRERFTNGDSDEQVLNYIVSRYGEFVLLKPRLSVQTLRGLPPLLRSRARRNEVNRQLLFGESPQSPHPPR